MQHFTIFGDGGSRGNPGPAGSGAVIYGDNNTVVAEISVFLGVRTNNFAEYESVILALGKLLHIVGEAHTQDTGVSVYMDSELVVKQMNGVYKVKHPVLKEQHARLKTVAETFPRISFSHIPRAQNKEADALANMAMDKGR